MKRVAKRGRPSKSAAVSDTDSETDVTAPSTKKKRGRPAKAKVVKSQTQDDQIAQLVAEAYAETATTAYNCRSKGREDGGEKGEKAKNDR